MTATERLGLAIAVSVLSACASARTRSPVRGNNAPVEALRPAGPRDALPEAGGAPASPIDSSPRPSSLADRIQDALHPLGPLHRPLVVLNEPSEYLPRVHLAFIGPPDHADAAWLAFDFAAEGRLPRPGERPGVRLLRVEDWIAGSAVVDHARSEALERVFVLVEAVDGASAPAGTRAVVSFDSSSLLTTGFSSYSMRRGTDWVELRGVSSLEQLRDAIHRREVLRSAYVDHARRRDVHFPTPAETTRDCASFVRALRTPRGWIEYLDPAGIDVAEWVFEIAPGAATHVSREEIASSSLADRIREVLRDEQREGPSCRGHGGSFLATEYDAGGPPRIEAVMLEPDRAAEPPRRGPFHLVAAAAFPAEARTAFRANFEHDLVTATAAPTEHGLVVAGTDGHDTGIMEWRGHAGSYRSVRGYPPIGEPLEVAFVRRDGATRTSVLLRSSLPTRNASPAPVEWFHLVFESGRSEEGLDTWLPDVESAWWMVGARDLDAATNALTHAPLGPISRGEACAVLTRAANAQMWRTAVTSDAHRIDFEEPGVPTYGRARPIDAIPRVACGELRCSHDTPHCSAGDILSERDYWFRREGNAWRLAGIAVYTGS